MNKGVPFSFILDLYPTATIAYSFRKLRNAYSGNCIEVRRSSDNTTQNIGFVANVLDEASLLSFVGAGDGFIKTWYDQSGNAFNLTATSDAQQPRIVTSGVVEKQNGKPAVYSTTAMRLNTVYTYSKSYDSAFTVCKITSTSTCAIPFSNTKNELDASTYYGVCASGSGSNCYQTWGTPSIYKNGSGSALTNTRGALYTAFITGNNRFLLSEFTSVTQNNSSRSTQYLGLLSSNFIQEHITYPTNKNSDKTAIESNINAYYAIY